MSGRDAPPHVPSLASRFPAEAYRPYAVEPKGDPLYRRHFAYARASARVKRRVNALLVYLDGHPESTRDNDDALRRLDDLVGEAERLRGAL